MVRGPQVPGGHPVRAPGGIAWNLLPQEFGVSPSTCWRRFDAWTHAGVWDKVHRKLLTRLAENGGAGR